MDRKVVNIAVICHFYGHSVVCIREKASFFSGRLNRHFQWMLFFCAVVSAQDSQLADI